VPVPLRPEGDSPIFAAKAAKIGTVPVNGYRSFNQRPFRAMMSLPDDQRPEPDSDSSSSNAKSISTTFLYRVKIQSPEAWQHLVELYGPVVYRWCRQASLRAEDAADVVQEVFAAAASHVAEFHRDQPGDSFSAWLHTITRNKIRDHFRHRQGRAEAQGGTQAHQQILGIPEPPEPPTQILQSDDHHLVSHRAMELVRSEFEDRTWQAFWRVAVEEQSPADVARDLGMTLHAVYKAKSRVLRRLREELGELPQ